MHKHFPRNDKFELLCVIARNEVKPNDAAIQKEKSRVGSLPHQSKRLIAKQMRGFQRNKREAAKLAPSAY